MRIVLVCRKPAPRAPRDGLLASSSGRVLAAAAGALAARISGGRDAGRRVTLGLGAVAATIHTLVLANVGAALPLILVLRDTHVGFGDAVNGQIVATSSARSRSSPPSRSPPRSPRSSSPACRPARWMRITATRIHLLRARCACSA